MQRGVQLRPSGPEDYPAVAEIYNRANPWDPPITAEWITGYWRSVDLSRPALQVLAEVDGVAIGFGVLSGRTSSANIGTIVAVAEAHRRRGTGTRLLRWLVERLDESRDVRSSAFEDAEPGNAFLRHHGFEERYRVFRSRLELEAFAADSFNREVGAATEAGIRFATLAEHDDEGTRRQVHSLTESLSGDVPRPDPIQPTEFEDWQGAWLEMSDSRADLLVVALDGDRMVAISYITAAPDGTGYNYFSGVVPDHRGQGLGTAVKVEALRRAREAGIRHVLTDNDTLNAAILAVNQRLGYERLPGAIIYGRTLGPGDAGRLEAAGP